MLGGAYFELHPSTGGARLLAPGAKIAQRMEIEPWSESKKRMIYQASTPHTSF